MSRCQYTRMNQRNQVALKKKSNNKPMTEFQIPTMVHRKNTQKNRQQTVLHGRRIKNFEIKL